MSQFEIIDDEGVVYSGSEDYIRNTWGDILNGYLNFPYKGDLKMVEVLSIHR